MNKTWIQHPTILKGQTVDLIPLEKDHFEELFIAASDKKLWELIPTDCSDREKFEIAYNYALTEREKGNQKTLIGILPGGIFPIKYFT